LTGLGTSWFGFYTVPGGTPSGSQVVDLEAVDTVGNVGTLALLYNIVEPTPSNPNPGEIPGGSPSTPGGSIGGGTGGGLPGSSGGSGSSSGSSGGSSPGGSSGGTSGTGSSSGNSGSSNGNGGSSGTGGQSGSGTAGSTDDSSFWNTLFLILAIIGLIIGIIMVVVALMLIFPGFALLLFDLAILIWRFLSILRYAAPFLNEFTSIKTILGFSLGSASGAFSLIMGDLFGFLLGLGLIGLAFFFSVATLTGFMMALIGLAIMIFTFILFAKYIKEEQFRS